MLGMISARRKHAILGSDVPAERSRGWLLVVLVAVVSTGCAHIPLRRNTINQARTVADIHQQQVLNNLAMFVYNPYSMPCFSYPTQGTNQVVNTTTAELNGSFSPLTIGFTIGQFVLNTLGFNGSAQYQSNEAFTMVPINDPRKLELMRCAYQRVVANCCGSFPSSNCPDCQTRFNSFYTGDPDGNIRQRTAGITTSECLNGPCWFCFGPKSAVPKHQPGILVAHYADMYVWVLPAGRDGLTRLTMTILDYAMNDPPVRLTKDIVYYIDEHGLPTNQLEAVGTVSAKVAIDERPEALLNI
ncbi:MAG TPA: hypothetical protein VG713_07190, partial [Pirellulales bacterium]|nr:hypothetical protein [Pirellulales bacterium]